MSIKAVIVDDNKEHRRVNSQLLEKYFPEIQVVAQADSVSTAVKKIKEYNPNLVLLDIEIKGGTGFDVLQQLKPYNFKFIFITAFNSFAIKAFKFSAMDYILKPVNDIEFQQAINSVLESLNSEEINIKQNNYLLEYYKKETQLGKIILRTSQALHVVDLTEIIYCKSDNVYTTFFLTTGEEIIVSKSLKEYVELLTEYGFFRVHQSYLVNLNYIKKVDKTDGGFVVMINRKEIPVSSRQRKKLIQILEKL